MRKQLLNILLFVILLLTVTVIYAPHMSAQQPIDIKITTIQMKHQQMGIGIDRFAKYAQEQLKGKVRIRTYPAGQLYSGREELQAVMKGEIQMAYIIGSILEQVDPSVELIKLPYLFSNSDHMYRVLEGPVGKKLFAKADQKGVSVVAMVSSGDVAIHNSKHPLKTVDDFKALKLRSYGPMGAACIKALGSIAVVSVPEEMYSSFQTGVLDGGANPATVFMARKLYDVQKYVTQGGMLNAAIVFLIVNKSWWDGLHQDIKTGLSGSIQRLVKEQRAEMEAENKILFQQIASKGSEVHYLTPTEQAGWKQALQVVYTDYAPKLDPEMLKELLRETERVR